MSIEDEQRRRLWDVAAQFNAFGYSTELPTDKTRISSATLLRSRTPVMCASACVSVRSENRSAEFRAKYYFDPGTPSDPTETVYIVNGHDGRQIRVFDNCHAQHPHHHDKMTGRKGVWDGSEKSAIEFVRAYLEGRLDGIS